MIQQIEFAQDYEVPYIRETLLNYLLVLDQVVMEQVERITT